MFLSFALNIVSHKKGSGAIKNYNTPNLFSQHVSGGGRLLVLHTGRNHDGRKLCFADHVQIRLHNDLTL